jgi:Condensation domain/TubC N-terminal docking domain
MIMPELSEYLSSLQKRGVRLWVDNGQLRYQASKGTLETQELARLRTMRSAILDELTKPPVVPANRGPLEAQEATRRAPTSFQQKWLLSLIRQHGAWQQPQAFAFHLTGHLEPQVLERSVAAALRRHDSLRARLVNFDSLPQLEIDAHCNYQLNVVSVSNSFIAEERHNIRQQIPDLMTRCADPAVGPMLCTKLLRISEQEHYLILVVHRLAADCLAIAQIFRELWLHYGEGRRAHSQLLTTEPGQYRDYTIWQQATDEPWQKKHAAYWRDYLDDAPRIHWPTDGGARSGVCGLASLQGSLGVVVSTGLRELGRKTQTLPALITLTLYISVVSKWCGQTDFVVPFNVAGRHASHDGVVGCFSHVLYLRVRFKGSERFPDLLRLVSNEFYKAVFHQDSGRMALRHPDLLGGTSCQCLSWHPAELAGREMYDVPKQYGIAAEPVHFQTARELSNVPEGVTDLEICFFESASDIGMLVIFRRELFMESTVERLIRELRVAAEQIVNDP